MTQLPNATTPSSSETLVPANETEDASTGASPETLGTPRVSRRTGSAARPRSRTNAAAEAAAAAAQRSRLIEGALIRERLRSLTVPVLGLVLVMLFGASRFAESRATEGSVLALGLPVIAMVAAALPLAESDSRESKLARLGALTVAITAEAAVLPAVLGRPPFLPAALTAGLLAGLVLVAAPLEARIVQRGFNTRLAAWAGIVAVFAIALPTLMHTPQADALGAVLAAFVVALITGGLGGLLLGVAARRLVGARS